jgi:hypothetical protein
MSSGTVPVARLSGTYAITANNATNLNGQGAGFYTDIPARLGYAPFGSVQNLDIITGTNLGYGFSYTGVFYLQASGTTVQLVKIFAYNGPPEPPPMGS